MPTPNWRIKEHLNVDWSKEYVSLDIADAAAGRTIAAVEDGSHVYPAQYDPERGGVVACIDLPAGRELHLKPAANAEDSGLRVEQLRNVIILQNNSCSAGLAAAASVEDIGDRWRVRGPIVWLRGSDGIERCASSIVIDKSRFFPEDRQSIARVDVDKIDAENTPPKVDISLEESGSVFIRYRYRIAMFDGRAYEFKATLYADYPVLFIEESSNLDRDGDLLIDLSHGFDPDVYFYGGVSGKLQQSVVPVPPYEYRLGSLTPHHTQQHTAFPWMGFMQSDHPQGTFRGICSTGIYPYSDALLFMAYKPHTWDYPGEVALQFETKEGRRVRARGPLRRGRRSYCLFITDRNEVNDFHTFNYGNETRIISKFALWHRKLNDLPLDWVRRLDLTSGAVSADACPQACLKADEYEEKKKSIFPQLAEQLNDITTRKAQTSELYARWMLDEDKDAARKLADIIIANTENKFALFINSGFLADAASAVAGRHLGPDAVFYEACVAAGVLSNEEKQRLQTLMLLIAHATAEDALFPSHTNYLPPHHVKSIRNWATIEQYSDLFGTPNFQTDVYYNLGLYGAAFNKHPKAREWMTEAATQMSDQLDCHFRRGGVYKESIGYFTHLFHNMLHLGSVLKRQGIRDFYADTRFHEAAECFIDYLAAPRKATVEKMVWPDRTFTDGTMRFWPSIGDTGHNSAEATVLPFVAHAAYEIMPYNKPLAMRLLTAWKQGGSPLWGLHAPMFEYLYLQDLEPETVDLELQSRYFTNVGTMLRADVGEPSETSVFFLSGRATHHWGFDHGHFTMTTRGSLLMPDYGYYGKTGIAEGPQVHGSSTWVHNVVTFGPDWNGGTGMERRGAERTIHLGDDYDYVVADLSLNNVRHNNWRNIQRIVPIEYFRHLLFAHNRYVLVWDRIDYSVYPSQLRVHALASAVDTHGSSAWFTGLDGVDLAVTMIAPQAPEFHKGMVGPQRFVMCRQDCQQDYLWLCQPIGKGESEFAVTSGSNVVTVKGTDAHGVAFEDHIIYNKGDRPVKVETNGLNRTLDGRFAIVSVEAQGKERVKLLDAVSVR